jgi:dUTP pyrophosphatase
LDVKRELLPTPLFYWNEFKKSLGLCDVVNVPILLIAYCRPLSHLSSAPSLAPCALSLIFVRMSLIHVKIINRSNNALPEYATAGSSGMDIRADLNEPVTIKPLERVLISTGLFIELPRGYEAQIRPRSGLAIKYGITCLNTPGTIDADYRGEIKVILINLSQEQHSLQPGDRIAQMIIQKVEKAFLVPVIELNETERNAGGFGHTGKQ